MASQYPASNDRQYDLEKKIANNTAEIVDNGGGGTPGGSNGQVQYNNAGAFGGLASTGTGDVVRANSPTLVTPVLGTPSSGNGSNITNVNAATLGAATFAAPGPIGSGTPSTVAATTLSATTVSIKADILETPVFAADAGASDTYVITLVPAITAYVTGAHYRFKANTANTGAATININGLGAKTIVKVAGGITTALADNDIRSGQWCDLVYDGTNMQIQSTLGNAAAGDVTLAGNNAFTGINSFAGSEVTPANALGAFAIDVTKGLNTKTVSTEQTFTFSGTPATANTWFSLFVTNSDAASHVVTIPSSISFAAGAAITTVTVPASGYLQLTWRYDGTNYFVYGDGTNAVSDTAFASSWNGVVGIAPSKNAVYDAFGVAINYPLTVYGAGTAYAFTNTAAAVDFGTTDPVKVLDKAGTYLIFAQVLMQYTGATVVAETATVKVRRTNNTAADLSQVLIIDLPPSTTLTQCYGVVTIPPFTYTTSATDDSITIFANVSAALAAGTIDATAVGTSVVAIKIF